MRWWKLRHSSISGWWCTYPSEKYDFVSWDDDIPNIRKNKKCSKPPTSIGSSSVRFHELWQVWHQDFMKFMNQIRSQNSMNQIIIHQKKVHCFINQYNEQCSKSLSHYIPFYWLVYPLVIQHSYWNWSFIVSFPIKNGDVP